MAAKNLCPYFHAHTIVVLSRYPIRAILHKHDASGRLLKWAIDLSEFDIIYCMRSSVKDQVLADFIVELSNRSKVSLLELLWIFETDGSSKVVGGEVGMVLLSLNGLLVS